MRLELCCLSQSLTNPLLPHGHSSFMPLKIWINLVVHVMSQIKSEITEKAVVVCFCPTEKGFTM